MQQINATEPASDSTCMQALIRKHCNDLQQMEAQIQLKEENIFKLSIENCKLWNQVHMVTEENIRLHDIED